MQGAPSSRDDGAFSIRVGIALTKVEDESRADEHFEEHDKRDAYVRVELLEKRYEPNRVSLVRAESGQTTYGDSLPETHDDGAGDEISTSTADVSHCHSLYARRVLTRRSSIDCRGPRRS
jgi:hypothetical protein